MRTPKDYGRGPFESMGELIAHFVEDYIEIATEPLREEIESLRSEVRELQRRK